MIRYTYINNQVLKLYSALSKIEFPLNMKKVIEILPKCRYLSYQDLARINNCSVEDVVLLCESRSGCTHYDMTNDRYLILCNHSSENSPGRQMWTCAHEIGHIVCEHHRVSAYERLSENSLSQIVDPEYEAEADYFASTLLAPFPLFKILNINSPTDIKNTFGLSSEASQYRYEQYMKWSKTRLKSSWENDMIRIYKKSKQKNDQLKNCQ